MEDHLKLAQHTKYLEHIEPIDITGQVVVNVWVDFADGAGWIKCQTDRVWSTSNWNPTSVPTGYTDTSQIIAGPANIQRHRLTLRNDSITPFPDLRVKGIKIGTIPYLDGTTNPPPPGGGGGGGGGTGGVLDSNGIRWFFATGQQGSIAQTRNEASMIDGLVM